MSTQKNYKTELPSAEERKKCLEVPKDQMRLIQQKEQVAKTQPQVIHIKQFLADQEKSRENEKQGKQEVKQGKTQTKAKTEDSNEKQESRLSDKCQKQLSPIKQMVSFEGKDLIDFDIEPERIQPKLVMRSSQEQLRRQLYGQDKQQQVKKGECQVQRKDDLTPRKVERIMKQLKEDEDKQNARLMNIKNKDIKDMKKKPSNSVDTEQKQIKKTGINKSKKQTQITA